MSEHKITWVDPIVPDEDDRCRYLRYKFENGQMLRQIDVRDSGGVLLYTLAFQEEEDITPQVGDEALRVDYVDINSTQKSKTCAIVTVTQEMIDGTISPTNLAPTDIALSNTIIPETTGIGDTVGTLSTFDPNIGDTHTYTILSDPDNKFDISSNILRLNNLVNFDTATSHLVTIRTTDQGLLFFDKTFTIIVSEITTFQNDKATQFQGNTFDTYMQGKPSEDILPGNGSFTLNAWVKNNNPVFIPTNINGLHIWLDADDSDTLIETTGKISQWNDKSGNSRDVTQVVSASRPVKNPSGHGTRNTVLFDGVDDFMTVNIPGSLDEMTVFIVSKYNQLTQGGADFDYLYSYGVSSANNLVSLARRASNSAYYLYDGGVTLNGPVLVGQQFQTHVQRINNVAPFHQYFQDGNTETVIDNDVAFSIAGDLDIGRFLTGTHHLDGDIAEILIYSRSLSTSERQEVESYLDEKWNNSSASVVSPVDIPNLGLWLDANDDSTISKVGADVIQWDDKSGNGNNAIPGTVSERPTITTNGFGVRNTVHFNAAHSLATTYASTANRTIFTVFKHNMDGAIPVGPLWQEDSTTSNSGFYPSWSDGNQYLRYGSNWMVQPTTFLQGVNYITSAVFDVVGNSLELYSNGVLNDSDICNITAGNNFTIGKRGLTSSFYSGEIAEIIVYDRALSTSERQDIETYLNDKWVLGNNPVFSDLKALYSIKQSVASGLVKAQVLWNEQSRLVAQIYDVTTSTIKSIEVVGNFADNTYKMITLEYDILNTLASLYVNEVLVGSVTVIAPASGDGLLTLATSFEVAPFYDGLMDELSIWDAKIDLNELYSGGFSFDLSTHSQTSTLRQWSRLGDQPDNYSVVDGILDRTDNSFHMTAKNMTSSNCVSDSVEAVFVFEDLLSLPFNGVDQRVLQPSTGMEFDSTDSFSLSVWVKYNGGGSTSTIIGNMYNSNGGVSPNYQGYRIRNIATRIVSLQLISNNGASFTQIAAQIDSPLLNNTWYHVCATYDGSNDASGIKFYIDGVLVASTSTINDTLNGSISHSNGISYGSRPDNGPSNPIQFFQGNLNELSVWDKELTLAEIIEVYNAGKPGNLNTHSAILNLKSWLGCGDVLGDSNLVLKDRSGQVADATMINYIPNPFDVDVP